MSWSLYCIYYIGLRGMRTYVGVTVDVERRLRQHNREIKGGARYTGMVDGNGKWQLLYTISGFPDQKTALQWEWRLHKHPKRRKGSCPACCRYAALRSALKLPKVTNTAIENKDLRLDIILHCVSPRDSHRCRALNKVCENFSLTANLE